MATDKNWMPSRLADRFAMFQNIAAKIGGYSAVLPLTTAQRDRILLICTIFTSVYNYVVQSRAATESLIEWRDLIFNGSPAGDAAPAPPAYAVFTLPENAFIGILTEFRELRELIVASPGYTQAIGEDLMIVAAASDPIVENETAPSLKVSTSSGYEVNITGSLQGMDAMRIEYQKKGSNTWNIAAFVTTMPASFTITPTTPGEPESGRLRAVFIKKNAEFGNFSPEYPITVS